MPACSGPLGLHFQLGQVRRSWNAHPFSPIWAFPSRPAGRVQTQRFPPRSADLHACKPPVVQLGLAFGCKHQMAPYVVQDVGANPPPFPRRITAPRQSPLASHFREACLLMQPRAPPNSLLGSAALHACMPPVPPPRAGVREALLKPKFAYTCRCANRPNPRGIGKQGKSSVSNFVRLA